jgi:hypothetical protein
MTSTRKMLLGTAAATIAVTGGVSTGAMAADAMLKKAPPIQYVRICDRYGYGFFQIPGSSICLQLRGQMQSDNAYQPTHDILFMQPAGKNAGTAHQPTVQFANQQDRWGYEMTGKPRFDARTETSMGTLRAYVELKIGLDAGNFNGPPGPGAGETGAGSKSELFRGYLQWAGWTIGEQQSIWSGGAFNNGDIADVQQTDKSAGWTVYYTWTPTGPGVPPVKGSAPVPDGWSFSVAADSPLKHIAKPNFTPGYQYLFIAGVGSPGVGPGGVAATTGPISIPDFVARLHYEADPPGKDDQHNDQFGIGYFHAAAAWHQITTIGQGGAGIVPAACLGIVGGCAFGPAVHDTGWAVGSSMKFFVPMWAGTKLGANRASNADNIQFEVLYSKGALEYGGIGGSMGALGAGDAYWVGGLAREDTDARLVNNGAGSYFYDKEKSFVLDAQYHSILTDCTDPVKCLALTLAGSFAWANPGDVTKNTDWTQNGMGNAKKTALSAELSWGVSRNGSTRPVFWRVDWEVQYLKVWQDLPCNNNGNLAAVGCGAPTILAGAGGTAANPLGSIAQNPDSWVFRTTITYDW